MRLTRYESSWLRTIGTIAFVLVAIYIVLPVLPNQKPPDEPLADASVLRQLIDGQSVPEPNLESSAVFHGTGVLPPNRRQLPGETAVLGVASYEEKRIEVDLTNQKVYAFESGRKVHEFLVSTGKWAPTPTGEFAIWAKVRSQKMSGGDRARGTYYYLPNVPYVMFFSNNEIAKMRGFSFHGTYWHENFGAPMSHGCINMRIEEAKVLYEWANPPVTNPKAWSTLASADAPGTRVIIYGETPRD